MRALIDRRAETARRELARDRLEQLDKAILSATGEFHRPRFVRALGRSALRAGRAIRRGGPFSGPVGARIGRRFAACFPRAVVLAFDARGDMVFQSDRGPRKTRSQLWRALLALQREGGGNQQDSRFEAAGRLCRAMFGSLTTLADLTDPTGLPRIFPDKGHMRLSWVLPEERFGGAPLRTGEESHGGLWILLDPADVPMRRLAARILRRLSPPADLAMIVRKAGNRPVIELARGERGVLRETLIRFFDGQTSWSDRLGSWVGRYVPQEQGRYMVAGIREERLRGGLEQARPLLLLAYSLVACFLAFHGWRTLWLGQATDLSLQRQVFALFALTSVLPLAGVFLQGVDLAEESARRSRIGWEKRIRTRLVEIDRRHPSFQASFSAGLRRIEEALTERLPLSASGLQEACAGLDRFEVVLIDEEGNRTPLNRGVAPIQTWGQYPNLMAHHLAKVIEGEGREPDPRLTQSFVLLSDRHLENVMYNLFGQGRLFNRLQARNSNLVQQKSVLSAPGVTPPRSIGMISWAFDEVAFSRPFVEGILAETASSTDGADALTIGFGSTDGRVLPPALGRSGALRRMVDRVTRFRVDESGMVNFPDGRRFLAVVTFPKEVTGHVMIGLIECHPFSDSRWWERIGMILGFHPVLAPEREEVFAWRVLAVSIVLSLSLMVPMALVLSRWIVGRIEGLTRMVREVGRKRFDARERVTADDELGELAAAFNDMAQGLQERERMSRFVSEQVLEEVKKDDRESLALGGERREVAVLFTHIHGFEDLVGRHEPPALIDLLNDYFTFVDSCLTPYHGQIDKLIGDAVMAVFFPRPGLEHPARRAVDAARLLLREAEAFDRRRLAAGGFPVRTDVGVHFGPAISGKVGSRRGMIDFTVIGDTVNTAARIQGRAAREPEPSLLISGDVLAHLPPDLEARKLPPVALKGKASPVQLFKCSPSSPVCTSPGKKEAP